MAGAARLADARIHHQKIDGTATSLQGQSNDAAPQLLAAIFLAEQDLADIEADQACQTCWHGPATCDGAHRAIGIADSFTDGVAYTCQPYARIHPAINVAIRSAPGQCRDTATAQIERQLYRGFGLAFTLIDGRAAGDHALIEADA